MGKLKALPEEGEAGKSKNVIEEDVTGKCKWKVVPKEGVAEKWKAVLQEDVPEEDEAGPPMDIYFQIGDEMNKLFADVGDILDVYNNVQNPPFVDERTAIFKHNTLSTVPVDVGSCTHTGGGDTPGPKKKRLRTKSDKRESNLEKYSILSPCPATCHKKCSEVFVKDERNIIYNRYWSLKSEDSGLMDMY